MAEAPRHAKQSVATRGSAGREEAASAMAARLQEEARQRDAARRAAEEQARAEVAAKHAETMAYWTRARAAAIFWRLRTD